jgi:hypothetical protein
MGLVVLVAVMALDRVGNVEVCAVADVGQRFHATTYWQQDL